jgi:hypothetical protein
VSFFEKKTGCATNPDPNKLCRPCLQNNDVIAIITADMTTNQIANSPGANFTTPLPANLGTKRRNWNVSVPQYG